MRDGVCDGDGPSKLTKAAWRFDLRLPKGAVRAWRTFAEPLIVGDVVVCATLDGTYCGLDFKTGRERWAVSAAPAPVRGGLSSALYFDGAGDASRAGVLLFCEARVVCVDPSSGAERWQIGCVAGEAQPALVGSTLLYSEQQSIVARELTAEGRELYRVPMRDRVIAPIAAGGSIAIAKSFDGTVTAIDLERGLARWHRKHARTGTSPLVLNEKRVFCPSGERAMVVALELDTGEIAWSRLFDEPCYGAFALTETTLFCSSFYGKQSTPVYALDEASGELRWRCETGGHAGGAAITVAAGSSRVYASAGSRLVACDARSGQTLASIELKSSKFATRPAITGSTLVVSTEHHVLAYRA